MFVALYAAEKHILLQLIKKLNLAPIIFHIPSSSNAQNKTETQSKLFDIIYFINTIIYIHIINPI